MRQLTCSFVIGVIGVIGLCGLSAARADAVRTISISCISAVTGQAVRCSASRIPPQTSGAASAGSVVEILDPIIRFEVKADLDGFDSREVELNAASFSSRNVQLRIALAPSFQPGWHPTLATLSDARRLLATESTIDRGLALMEQIDKVVTDTETVGTFEVRHQYWRVVGLVKACTRCFYQTCDDAADAVTALEAAIAANQSEFGQEHLSNASLDGLSLSIAAAGVNNTVRRANWYLALNEFSRAREEYQRARTMLVRGGAELSNEVGLTLKVLDDDLQLVDTRERQQAESSGNTTGPVSVPQAAESPIS